jgi:WD40 repeat protein
MSPDGTLLVSGSDDKTIKLWSLPEGKLLNTLEGHSDWVRSVTISPDGTLLASGSYDKTVRLWTLPEGEPNWCLFDPAVTEIGAEVKEYKQMGHKTITLPCGSPTPAGATCICDCIATSIRYETPETVCVCDTIMVPVGSSVPAGAVCTCLSKCSSGHWISWNVRR